MRTGPIHAGHGRDPTEWTLFTSGNASPGARHGLPTAVALVACACTALTFLPATARAEVGPGLAATVAAAAPDAQIPVLVTLRRQVDAQDFEGRPQALLAALRRTAAATQPDVVDIVDDQPVKRFWLINAIAVRATPAEIAELDADPGVERVDADVPVRLAQSSADAIDSFPDPGEGDWGLAAIRAPEVWDATGLTGAGIMVGSIDTGVNAAHRELAGKVVGWRDFVNNRPAPYDDNGHGTHTIGTMVGGSEGGAAIGVAPGARVIVAKAIGASGVGPGSALIAAAQWMTDPDGDPATADQPVAVNNSWSAEDANDPWFRTIIRRWVELGITPVFAAGNTGPDASTVGSPAGYPEALAVGALNENDTVASFSSRGPVTWLDLDGTGPARGTVITKPDVSAPGVNITSSTGDGYLAFSGTSMASPHVAGVIALMAQANPQARGATAAEIIRSTAVDRGPAGPDQRYGSGRIDAVRAVQAVLGPASALNIPDTAFEGSGPLTTRARTVVLRVRTENGDGYRFRVNGGRWSAVTTSPWFRVNVRRGRNTVDAQAMSGGTLDRSPARRVVVVDRTPPRLVIGYRVRGRDAVFVARAADGDSSLDPASLRWSLGDGRYARGPRVDHVFPDDGYRVVRLYAKDRAGNAARATRVLYVGR